MRKSLMNLILLAGTLALAACQTPENDQHATASWPNGLVTPISDVTFSMSAAHLPGPSQSDNDRPRQGFSFVNGHVGRPLMSSEGVVAVADGEIVRIDHVYPEQSADLHDHWLALESEPGFLGAHARDQLLGRQIWLSHASGHLSRYAQLTEVHPQLMPGDSVEQGQIIGLVGTSDHLPLDADGAALLYELWSPDGSSYLGEGLDAFQAHRLLARLFSDAALPRYARQQLDSVKQGDHPPATYPPEHFEDTEFAADVPETVVAGTVFTIPLEWDAQQFHVNELFASIDGQPMGILKADGGAITIGTIPVESDRPDASLVLGGINQYGQTMAGNATIQVRSSTTGQPQPLEVDASILALYTESNQELEMELVGQATQRGLMSRTPAWSQAFLAPVSGTMAGTFGQPLVHGMMRPQHPLPGILILPEDTTTVTASNDGIVVLATELPIRGPTVAIAHGGGIVSIYARLDEISVNEGDAIRRGEPLGSLRKNGAAQDQVLLWEIQVAGVSTNPQNWLNQVLPQ